MINFLFAIIFLFPSLAYAQAGEKPTTKQADTTVNAAKADKDVEEVEVVEDVTDVSNERANTAGNKGLLYIVGRLHAAMVHFPIAWVFLLLLMQIAMLSQRFADLSKAAMTIHILAVASYIPAIFSGFMRVKYIPDSPEFSSMLTAHHIPVFSASALCMLTLIVALIKRDLWTSYKYRYVRLALVTITFLLFSLGGHNGGKLVFGANFLN
jgi:uncharacterized membrane protein